MLAGIRSLPEVKKRGLWRTDQSLRRYGKEAKILAELRKIPDPTMAYALSVESNLEAVFHRAITIPLPLVVAPPLAKRQRLH